MNIQEIHSYRGGRGRDDILNKDMHHSCHKEGSGDCSYKRISVQFKERNSTRWEYSHL